MRYTDEQLEALLADIESDLSERKESWSGDAPEKGRQAVCAFANDLPDHQQSGALFVGARDDGTPTHLSITDKLLRTLSDIKTDGNILPPPSILVEKRTLKGVEMAVVIVQPSDGRFATGGGYGSVAVHDVLLQHLRKSVFSTKGDGFATSRSTSNPLRLALCPRSVTYCSSRSTCPTPLLQM